MEEHHEPPSNTVDEISYPKLALFLLALIAAMFSPLLIQKTSQAFIVSRHLPETPVASAATALSITPFHETALERFKGTPINLEAHSAVVWDVNSNSLLYAKNADVQLPLASLAKLMTVSVAAETLESQSLLTIPPSSLDEEGDSGLFANETWNGKDLIDFLLMVSSNDAAHVLATRAGEVLGGDRARFIERMNEKAREVGLTQTYFVNETGLDPSDAISGSYGSARDMAFLMQYILENQSDLLTATTKQSQTFISLDGFTHEAKNTNELVNRIPGLLASKTGFTDLAGGNLVVAFDAGLNKPMIIVVLGSTFEGRFKDVEKLVSVLLTPTEKEQ